MSLITEPEKCPACIEAAKNEHSNPGKYSGLCHAHATIAREKEERGSCQACLENRCHREDEWNNHPFARTGVTTNATV